MVEGISTAITSSEAEGEADLTREPRSFSATDILRRQGAEQVIGKEEGEGQVDYLCERLKKKGPMRTPIHRFGWIKKV